MPMKLSHPSQSLTQFTSSDLTPLIKSISIYLSHSIGDGDSYINSSTTTTPTRFQAQSKPSINIHDYLTRLINLSPIPTDGVLLGLVYFKRITTTHPPEPESSNTSPSLILINSLTIHRLILSCMILATKFISDRPLHRKRLSKVAGVSEIELDHLERELLIRLDFKLCWPMEEVDRLTFEVLQSSPRPISPLTSPPTLSRSSLSPSLEPTQHNYRSSISSPITIPIQPPMRRHSTSRGIVFVKSQFIDCNLLARKYGLTSSNNSSSLDQFQDINSSSPPVNPPSSITSSITTTTIASPTPKSTSKIIVTRLEHNQIKICHTQVF